MANPIPVPPFFTGLTRRHRFIHTMSAGHARNGLSSSPSNTPPPYNGPRFPDVRVEDDVHAQHKLVTEHFGIERLAAVTGWSMGAGQAYQWAGSYIPGVWDRFAGGGANPADTAFIDPGLQGLQGLSRD